MSQKITDVELTAVKGKFQTLCDDLAKAGLKSSMGIPAQKKVLAYALKRIGCADVNAVSNIQWEKFFQQTDGLRFDFPGLARHIGSLVPPAKPAEFAEPDLPAFSASDMEMLHDAGISPLNDSRTPGRYWREKA